MDSLARKPEKNEVSVKVRLKVVVLELMGWKVLELESEEEEREGL